MPEEIIRRDFLRQHGEKLIEQGYVVVPIQPGKKAPGFDGWQKSKGRKEEVRAWLESGFKNAGVGILTKHTCAIDIDCRDEDAALAFEKLCIERFGPAPVRIGMPPKRLLLYRATEPFKKRKSSEWLDDWGAKNQIECLGDGQQFVAFHIHPDTGKPYNWVNGSSPLNVRASDLSEVSLDQMDELISEFEQYAKDHGWDLKKASRHTPGASTTGDDDNPWLEDSRPIDISDDELRQRLMLVTGAEDYDTWFQVGMALYHQYDGDETGFELWNEWSETADNYDRDSLDRHWKSFDVSGKGRAPLTARFIMRLAKEAVQKTTLELGVKIRDAFAAAKTMEDWVKAKEMAREAEIDGLTRSSIASIAKASHDSITGTKTPLGDIRKAIAYHPKASEETPDWVMDWVYDVGEDRFFHTRQKYSVTKQGFDAMYDRKAMTKKEVLDGKDKPTLSASDLALTVYRIPTVNGQRYMPGRDSIFHEVDGTFANTYPEHEIPEVPEKLLPKDLKAIDRVRGHIVHLLSSTEEQTMLMDWLSWVVQNPGKHANYAVLLQGVEGDGKSFFAELLRAVMGVNNVTMLNAHIVHSDFTDWAYGQCVACLEEVRIVGKRGSDKWETINRIKPFVTNNVIEIHPKGKPVFNVINTTSYLLFSNYKDALPLDENSRRYLILFSRWQHRDALMRFKTANPMYYQRLYETLGECAGALRKWLLEHEQGSEFNPQGDAPETQARRVMISKSKPEFIQVLDEIIAEDANPAISRELLDLGELAAEMAARGIEWPGPKALTAMLERDGFEYLGRLRASETSERVRLYSKCPEEFMSIDHLGNSYFDRTKSDKHLKQRKSERPTMADPWDEEEL